MRNTSGFTLIEMLIALLVFALGAVVAQGNLVHIGRHLTTLEARTFASWIAQNHMTDLQVALKLGDVPDHVRQQFALDYAGQSWQLSSELVESNAALLRRVEITVCREGGLCHGPLSRYVLLDPALSE